jgi:cytochrome c biogenesis protein ResB
MTNAVFGSSVASSGERVVAAPIDGPPTLHVSGLAAGLVSLAPGQTAIAGGYEYTFAGQRPFAGIQVKRDQGATFIWVALGLLIAGMVTTFHVPRRRAWAKITPARTYLAGLAGPLVDFGRELREIGAEAGAPDALLAEDALP